MNMTDPLPSWKSSTEGGTGSKEAIINFVENVASKYNPEDRIVTFDNDGTLWSERPRYFQEYFMLPALLNLDKISLQSSLEKSAPLTREGIMREDGKHYIGKTTEEYVAAANTFVYNTNHPTLDRPFSDLTYQPLIELLDYLRANEFQIYICSGGGRDFVRSFSQGAYDIPPENVIGSSVVTEYDKTQGSGGSVVRTKVAETDASDQADKGLGQYNDKEGKPVGIQRQIGKRPIMAVGNSTGDLQMFDYTDQGAGNSLIVLINHDDGDREFKYNDGTEGENLSWDKAQTLEHWLVVSMANDFNTIFTSD